MENGRRLTTYSVYEFVKKIEDLLIDSHESWVHESGPYIPRQAPEVDWAVVGKKMLSYLSGSHELKWRSEIQKMFDGAQDLIQIRQKMRADEMIGLRNAELLRWKKALQDLESGTSQHWNTPLLYVVEKGHEPVVSVQNPNNPRSQSEDLGVATNDKVEGKQNLRTEDRSHNPEIIQTRPPTDSGYASATHDKFKHTQNARAEDYTQSTEEVQFRPPMDEGYASATKNISEVAQNPKDLEWDDARTVYSDASSLPALEKENYISELADDLFSKVRSEQADGQTVERISGILPELLKAFALKVGHNAPTQMHRDVMFFIHKNRR